MSHSNVDTSLIFPTYCRKPGFFLVKDKIKYMYARACVCAHLHTHISGCIIFCLIIQFLKPHATVSLVPHASPSALLPVTRALFRTRILECVVLSAYISLSRAFNGTVSSSLRSSLRCYIFREDFPDPLI